MKLSVVVPVYNGSKTLAQCLEALGSSSVQPDEIIVVDDSSTDDSSSIAQRYGVRVLSLSGGPHGPAAARNRGVDTAQGETLVFVDADIAVHPDALERMERCLGAESRTAAVFGSYDANPPVKTLVSRYKNLMHHYVHQHGKAEASTFWTGCGAIRRSVYLEMGGLDETFITIEDIELGVRLTRAGHRIRLCPEIQGTHLKHWTFAGLLREDILRRAVPWTRLILREENMPADLNVDSRSRASALLAWLLPGCFLLGFWIPWAWIGALAAGAGILTLNWKLYRFFARNGGPIFALGAACLHVLYLLYSSLTFALVVVWEKLAGRDQHVPEKGPER